MVTAKLNSRRSVFLSFVTLFPTLLFSALLLSGCFEPKTPQDVAKVFWQAVIDNNAKDVVRYSTLSKPDAFDGLSMDWRGFKPSWGKIIIDGDHASIEIEFSGPTGAETAKRQCVTYLVRKNDVWKVDYKLTQVSLSGGAIGNFLGTLNQLGSELSKNFDSSVKQLDVELERLSRKFKEMAESFSHQASKIVEQHAEELQKIMKELEESINRALEDGNNHLSDRDKQVMKEVAADLDASSQHLSTHSAEAITKSNNNMALAKQRLDSVNSGAADEYNKHWEALFREFEDTMRTLLDELAQSEKRSQEQNPQ